MADLIGQHISNYEITGVLGKGGMAVVYRARQSNIQREVAIKVIKPDLIETEDLILRFKREANTVAALSHPHILKLFDFGEYDGMLYLVMELLPGGTLSDAIRDAPIPAERAVRLLNQIANALDYAHSRGLIHRDLKPQNILLDGQGNAHLTDFGIAKVLTQDTVVTQTGVAIGTPAYMPPEQWQGRPLDARADIYALGVMLYEMLTGRLPFKADTPASFMYRHLQDKPPSILTAMADLPRDVDKVIQKAMAKTPENRFASAGEMAKAFQKAVESSRNKVHDEVEPPTIIGGMDLPPTTPVKETPSRMPLAAIVGGVVFALVTIGLLITRLLPIAASGTPTVPVSEMPTQAVVLATSMATSTDIPTVSTTPSSTESPTAAPTLDQTLVSQNTQAALSSINAARTQLYIDDQTKIAAAWTATPTSTPTIKPTLTPTVTYTPSIVPTPDLPVWDDFHSQSAETTLWEIKQWNGGITKDSIVDGVLRLETNGNQTRWIRAGGRIRTFAALATAQTDGSSVNITLNGATSDNRGVTFNWGFDCKVATLHHNIGRQGHVDSYSTVYKALHTTGCPQKHLLLITVDGKRAEFYIDGERFTSFEMIGLGTAANISASVDSSAKSRGLILIEKVWAKFG